jgi:hypothetical protein
MEGLEVTVEPEHDVFEDLQFSEVDERRIVGNSEP